MKVSPRVWDPNPAAGRRVLPASASFGAGLVLSFPAPAYSFVEASLSLSLFCIGCYNSLCSEKEVSLALGPRAPFMEGWLCEETSGSSMGSVSSGAATCEDRVDALVAKALFEGLHASTDAVPRPAKSVA